MGKVQEKTIINKILRFAMQEGADQYIAQIILQNIKSIDRMSTTDIAQLAAVAQSTVSKFIKKLGYDDFTDFKIDLLTYQKAILEHNFDDHSTFDQNILNGLNSFISNFSKIRFSKMRKIFRNNNHIIINASGVALRACSEFAISLRKKGYLVSTPQDFETRYAVNLKSNPNTLILCITDKEKSFETVIPTIIASLNNSKILHLSFANNTIDFGNNVLETLNLWDCFENKQITNQQLFIALNIVLMYLTSLIF